VVLPLQPPATPARTVRAALATKGWRDMNKSKKKLALASETVRDLRPSQIAQAIGGRINLTRASQCDCPTFTCTYTEGGCTF
jgi:hypothetical protein